jgi:hypothetical protein
MGRRGVNCFDCHGADRGDVDALEHEGHLISVLVTPRDCGLCHPKEADQQAASVHARAAESLSGDELALAEVVTGPAAFAVGCRQCHGSVISVEEGGTLRCDTWPNTGIGRLNPDGSRGSCSACHSRHRFTRAEARHPQACGKCHRGPGHPQVEVYEGSKHGLLLEPNALRMNYERRSWVGGVDYVDAPTCASCHISTFPGLSSTHNVSARVSWNLRTPVPTRSEGWKKRRAAMARVCCTCHDSHFVEDFFVQADGAVAFDRDKFAVPAAEIMKLLAAEGRLTAKAFDEPLEWIYRELWHHAQSRARNGAVMGSPESAWSGTYEVSKLFYMEFLPEVRRAAGEELYRDIEDRVLRRRQEHRWLFETPPAD